MTKVKQLIAYTSMFSSICWIGGHRLSSSDPASSLKTVGNARAPKSNYSPGEHFVQFSAVQDVSDAFYIKLYKRSNLVPQKITATTTTSSTTTSTTTTTEAPTTTTTVAEAPRIIAEAPKYDNGCLGHKMSREAAYGCWAGLLATKPWPLQQAFNVMYCESTGESDAYDPISVSGEHAEGLMQVLDGSTDPQTNINQAFVIWQRDNGTFKEWVC